MDGTLNEIDKCSSFSTQDDDYTTATSDQTGFFQAAELDTFDQPMARLEQLHHQPEVIPPEQHWHYKLRAHGMLPWALRNAIVQSTYMDSIDNPRLVRAPRLRPPPPLARAVHAPKAAPPILRPPPPPAERPLVPPQPPPPHLGYLEGCACDRCRDARENPFSPSVISTPHPGYTEGCTCDPCCEIRRSFWFGKPTTEIARVQREISCAERAVRRDKAAMAQFIRWEQTEVGHAYITARRASR